MKPSFYKGIVLGAAVSILVLVASTAVAGTGIGGIFNLGQSNTVDATSALSGASVGPQLQVTNSGTGTGAQGIAAFNNSAAATLYGRNSGAGPGVSGRADKKNNGVEGVSAGSGASGVYGANTSANGYGVAGRSLGAGGIGVYGNNTGGGMGVFGKSSGSNGIQGTTASATSSGVYGENTSTGGYGVAGRSLGDNGIGVYGDNTAGGWAGFFTGGVHLGGTLDCAGCVVAADLAPGAGNRVGGYELVSASSVHDNLVRTERNIVVDCPPGKMVLGGGGWAQEGAADKKAAIVDSSPSVYYPPGGGTPEPVGWFVKGEAMTIPYNTTLDVGVYAICANVSP
jgi:hypothetical protein